MRGLRGALALWGVYDVDVEHPKIGWIPETDEERQGTDRYGFSHSNIPLGKGTPRTMPIDQFIRPLISRQALIPMEIPLEFFRRGAEDLHEQRYVEAVYDFYFVLEYLFADGQFTKSGTRAAMLQSPEVARIICESQNNPLPEI